MKRLEQLKRYDVITFDDDEKVVVLTKCEYKNRHFVYVNEILPDESDVTEIYKLMEIHLEDGTLEKIVDINLLQEIMPIIRKNLAEYVDAKEKKVNDFTQINKSTYGYFYELVDRLVKWMRKEEYCSLEVLGISVTKDYEGSNEYIKRIHVGGYLNDSDRDMDMFFNLPNSHPSDKKFSDEVFEWFEVGKPREESLYEIYQNIGCFKSDDELIRAMKFLEKDVREKYPGVNIEFYIPESPAAGCYIATAVYGSYNCPEVWALRRFRDNVLSNYLIGRAFIKQYYRISPTLVKKFGMQSWFNRVFRRILDEFVKKLRSNGISDEPYVD